ncbi:PxKF domain-containing protein [Nocardioides bigeumensis]|uniref:Uncharacterized protein n=1 Tax=Nocardioides bigeumensis TaxID=433657 RepID=A0ABN2YNY6_9ACTN
MRRMITALVLSLAAVLLAPGVAHADAQLVAYGHVSSCADQGVNVQNPTSGAVNLRIYQDGVQVFPASGWSSRRASATFFVRWPLPAPGSQGESRVVEEAADGSEVLLTTTTYVRPGFCDTVTATITENCGQLRVQAYNGWTSTVDLGLARSLAVGGATAELDRVQLAAGGSYDKTFALGPWRNVGAAIRFGNFVHYLTIYDVTGACDPEPPTATITSPADGASYVLGSSVAADYACADGGLGSSGLASCVGTVADGAAVDTTTVGSHEFVVTATDNSGQTGGATSTYDVVYDWSGFFAPIDAAPVVNTTKAGAAVPMKFGLGGDQGVDVLAAGSPSSRAVACVGGTPTDELEQTSTAGSSGLSYDATTQTYTYVWKTQKAWANSCRQLVVELVDGTTHTAAFRFK